MEEKTYSTDLVKINSLEDIVVAFDLSTISSSDFGDKYSLLVSYVEKLTELKKKVDTEIKRVMEDEYNTSGDTSIVAGERRYTYIPPTTRVTIDTKKLQADLPDVYAKYAKVSQVSATLKSTVVGDKGKRDKGKK